MSGESNSAKCAMNSASRRSKDIWMRKPGPGLISADLGLLGTLASDSISPLPRYPSDDLDGHRRKFSVALSVRNRSRREPEKPLGLRMGLRHQSLERLDHALSGVDAGD